MGKEKGGKKGIVEGRREGRANPSCVKLYCQTAAHTVLDLLSRLEWKVEWESSHVENYFSRASQVFSKIIATVVTRKGQTPQEHISTVFCTWGRIIMEEWLRGNMKMTVSIKLSAYPAYSRLNSGSKKSLHKIKNFFFTLIKSKINI